MSVQHAPPTAQALEPVRPPRQEEIDLYRSEMTGRFGLLMLLFRLMFRRIASDEQSLQPLRKAAAEGTVVYVMRNRSALDYVFFNAYFRRHGLPLARFANGVNMLPWLPPLRAARLGWRKLRDLLQGHPAPDPVDSGFLRRLVAGGQPALLFLRRRGSWLRRPQRSKADLVEEVVRAQDLSARPIFLVPQTIVWQRRPDRADPGALGVILGQGEDPGRFWKLLHFLAFHRNAVVRTGEPIDLKEFLASERARGTPVPTIARKLHRVLRGYLYREEKLVKGPAIMPRARLFERILDEPHTRAVLEDVARAEGREVDTVRRKARRILDRTAADFRFGSLMLAKVTVDLVVSRIYSGVEFDAADAEEIRKAARRGTVVYVPCHRSHLDYILISWASFCQHIQPPHIAAGINLSFWPAGPFLKRCGAFFIRRSFRGDRLYEAVLTGYVRELTRQGYTQEFFIEGGRSRTGKLLRPRTGMLGMYLDAAHDRLGGDVLFVPMALGYERVVEEKEYFRELTGGEKRKEDIRGLVKTTGVLRRRYGRVYVKSGPAISGREYIESLGVDYAGLDAEGRRAMLQDLGERILHAIHQVTVVTPSAVAATVLLSHERRGLALREFERRALFLVEMLVARGAVLSRAMSEPGRGLAQSLERLAADRHVEVFDREDPDRAVVAIPAERRLTLDYYKNNIVNHFADASMLALALRTGDGEALAEPELRDRFAFLYGLFAEEFTHPPDRTVDDAFAAARAELLAHGVVEAEEGGLGPASAEKVQFLSAILVNFLESYRVVIGALRDLGASGRAEPEKAMVKRILVEGRKMYMTEDVTRQEALSKTNYENALRALKARGILRPAGGDGAVTVDREALGALADALRPYARLG